VAKSNEVTITANITYQCYGGLYYDRVLTNRGYEFLSHLMVLHCGLHGVNSTRIYDYVAYLSYFPTVDI